MTNYLKTLLLLCLITTPALIPAQINTVKGTIEGTQLGFALTHEHLFSNFGKDPKETSKYDEAALLRQVIPYLKRIKTLGVNSIFDCTTAGFGRRVDLLKTISDSTGLHIITNTGFYGAANDRYVPPFVHNATAGQVATLWVNEFRNGIDGTGIKPGFIKLAFDDGPPSETDVKLFTAGILAHKQTGLTMAVHTGNNQAAIETQLSLLAQHGVKADALVIVHAQSVQNTSVLIHAARQGAWISLDGVNASNTSEYIEKLKLFRSNKLLHKVLLSHDGDLFTEDGSLRELSAVMEQLIPAMRAEKFSEKEIRQLMVINPLKAFGA